MNCCTGNCNQGRDCPARQPVCAHCYGIGYDASGQHCTCLQGAKVARIGRKDYDREPIPPMAWRSTMQRLAHWVLYGILGMFWLAYVVAVVRWAYA